MLHKISMMKHVRSVPSSADRRYAYRSFERYGEPNFHSPRIPKDTQQTSDCGTCTSNFSIRDMDPDGCGMEKREELQKINSQYGMGSQSITLPKSHHCSNDVSGYHQRRPRKVTESMLEGNKILSDVTDPDSQRRSSASSQMANHSWKPSQLGDDPYCIHQNNRRFTFPSNLLELEKHSKTSIQASVSELSESRSTNLSQAWELCQLSASNLPSRDDMSASIIPPLDTTLWEDEISNGAGPISGSCGPAHKEVDMISACSPSESDTCDLAVKKQCVLVQYIQGPGQLYQRNKLLVVHLYLREASFSRTKPRK